MLTNRPVWGIRSGGEYFDASSVFKSGYIGIGWSDLGDLSKLPADQSDIKKHLMVTHQKHPDITLHRFEQGAGALYRFKYVMQDGDIVVYEDKPTGKTYIGTVDGSYKYDRSVSADAPHLRPVKWKHKYPSSSIRTRLTQRGQTLWEIRNPQEFRDLMED